MKITKIMGLIFVGLFLISLGSASDYYSVTHRTYDEGDLVEKISYHVDKDFWENEDRQPVYNYRHGYSYRASKEYLKDRIEEDYRRDRRHHRKGHDKHEDYWDYDQHGKWGRVWGDIYEFDDYHAGKVVQYNYVPYLDSYERRDCYNYRPRNMLFYFKCD